MYNICTYEVVSLDFKGYVWHYVKSIMTYVDSRGRGF